MTCRILSIDGGGIRGLLPAMILAELERRSGKTALQLFDLVAGTSTGGIIACGLAAGLPATALVSFYVEKGTDIFYRSAFEEATNPDGVRCPRYDPTPLEAELLAVLGDKRLSDAPCDIAVPSYCMALPAPAGGSTRTPWVFSAANAKKDPRYDFLLRDVARATSAAPTYFPLAQVKNVAGEAFAFADGGLFANNPAMVALTRAHLWQPGAQGHLAVSLGTGALEAPFDVAKLENAGALEQLAPVLSMEMDGGMDETVAAMDAVLGERHVRLDISLGADPGGGLVAEAFDDASPENITQIIKLGNLLIQQQSTTLDKLLQEIA